MPWRRGRVMLGTAEGRTAMREADDAHLVLLGRFELLAGCGDVVLPKGAQRLLAYLAIHHGDGVSRQAAAEQLWPECRRQRATANVRQALWHLRRATERPVVEPSVDRLRLSPALTVDFCRAVEAAHLVVSSAAPAAEDLTGALYRDLLPYWADDWLAPERRRWEQVRLHALEAIAQHLIAAGAAPGRAGGRLHRDLHRPGAGDRAPDGDRGAPRPGQPRVGAAALPAVPRPSAPRTGRHAVVAHDPARRVAGGAVSHGR